MKLGVMIESQEGVTWTDWQNIVQWTEELGFESLWRSDHFYSFTGPQPNYDSIDTMVAHTYTAAMTKRIMFGPLVLSMTFRHPSMLARMTAAIDQLSNGRFIVSVGAGWNDQEHAGYGIPFPLLKERMDRLEEGVQVMKALFEQDRAYFNGKYYQLNGAPMWPKPVQKPMRIQIGGGGEQRTLQMVARYATDWNIGGGRGGGVELYRQKREVLERHCEAEKRDPKTIDRSYMVAYITGHNDTEIQKQIDEWLPKLPERFRTNPKRPMGALIGTPSQLVEQILELEAEGVSRLMLQYLWPPRREDMQLIAEEVLPKVSKG